MFKCDVCEKEFESQASFAGHRSGHVRRGELEKFQPKEIGLCKICGQRFENGSRLGGHMRLHRLSFDELGWKAKKFRLIAEFGNTCQVCGLNEWMGKTMPIELDHIDGNPENNERENLRLICPNCHAQTDTYKGRNVGKVQNSKRAQTLKKYYGRYR